jgi:hypothetical protein
LNEDLFWKIDLTDQAIEIASIQAKPADAG